MHKQEIIELQTCRTLLALMGLNKDEAIYTLIFKISIYWAV